MQAPFEQVPAPLVKEHTLPIRPLEMTEVVSNDSGSQNRLSRDRRTSS